MAHQRHFNWYNFFVCFLVSCGQIAFGYPASIIGTTLGEPSFLSFMKLVDPKTGLLTSKGDQLEGAMSGVFQAGAFFGVILVSYVMDHWGRKWAMVFCSFFSLVGGALLCGSKDNTMFIVARFIAGLGSWGFLAVTPVYTAELAPPSLRGFFVGMNGVGVGVGYSLASYMGLAFFFAPFGETQWRGPLGIALLWPFIMLIIVSLPFIPESPRWLLLQNRVKEAEDIVLKLHSIPGDENNTFARAEFYQMRKQAELDRTLNPSWMEMFRRPSYRKRVMLAMGFAFIGQSTAILVINNYGPSLYAALGYGTKEQLAFQCGWITVAIIFNLVGASIMDRVGRRPLMILGVSGCCVALIIEAAMVSNFAAAGTNKAGLGMGVAAFYLFLALYSVGVDVAGLVFYGELFPNHIRAKGLCVSVATIAITDLVYLQATATAFANIGWKFYLVFIIISGLGAILMYYVIPETKGIPLEEMAKIFGDTKDVMVYAADIHLDHTNSGDEFVIQAHDDSVAVNGSTADEKAQIKMNDVV